MKLFWKINIYVSVIVFSLFMLYFIIMYFEIIIPNLLLDIPGLLFFYAPFLEVIQIPLCLTLTLFTLKKQTKIVWIYFLIMVIFFIVKISVYILILGSIISFK